MGGGGFPCLSLDTISQLGIEYTVLDIRDSVPTGYAKVVADVCAPESIPGTFDFVFSAMLAEHVVDPEALHRNILSALIPRGIAFHFFPTVYALPYLVGLVLPDNLRDCVLRFLQPWRFKFVARQPHFRAYQRRCRGPLHAQVNFFRSMGYTIEQYIGFFGSNYYDRISGIWEIQKSLCEWLLRHPYPLFTDYAYVILRKR